MKIITIIFFILSSWHLLNFLFSRSLKSENDFVEIFFFILGRAPGHSWAHLSSAGPRLAWRSMGCQAKQPLRAQLGRGPCLATPAPGHAAPAWAGPAGPLGGRGPCLGKASGRACRPARVSENPSPR